MNISIPTSSNFLTELRDILFERIKVAEKYKTLNPEELRLENETTVAIISLSKAITRQMNAAARLGELDLTVNPYAKDACELLLKKQANTMTNISTTVVASGASTTAPASNIYPVPVLKHLRKQKPQQRLRRCQRLTRKNLKGEPNS